jgi:hypothetical protein
MYIVSLSQKFHVPKNSMGYAKKRRKRKISLPKGMRGKNACQRA